MRKLVVVAVIAVVGLAGVLLYKRNGSETSAAAAGAAGAGGRGGTRPPMPVETAPVTRGAVAERATIVGTLIGAATVEAVPKVNGRLQEVNVRLGDPVRRGQAIAKVEDREIREQVNQAEAAFKVSDATIRQREADLKLAQTNLDRNKSLLERQLLPRQTYDDTEARYQAAVAQLDLARAQHSQSKARLDELQINLANTVISSPVDGFIGKRYLDPGAAVSPNAPVASVVDIRTVRMVVNVVEKDVRRLTVGMAGAGPGRCVPGREVRRPRQPDRAGLRSSNAHGGDGNRSSEPELPAQAGHVRARRADPRQPAERADTPARRDRGARGQDRYLRRERAGASLKCGAVAGRRSCADGAVRAGRRRHP